MFSQLCVCVCVCLCVRVRVHIGVCLDGGWERDPKKIRKLILIGFLLMSGIVRESLHKLYFILMSLQKLFEKGMLETREFSTNVNLTHTHTLMLLVILHEAIVSVLPT